MSNTLPLDVEKETRERLFSKICEDFEEKLMRNDIHCVILLKAISKKLSMRALGGTLREGQPARQ